jgi:hypothetical protein
LVYEVPAGILITIGPFDEQFEGIVHICSPYLCCDPQGSGFLMPGRSISLDISEIDVDIL